MPPPEDVYELARTYADAMNTTMGTFSYRRFGNYLSLTGFVGTHDIGYKRVRAFVQWLSDNWPVDVEWPKHILRPSPAPRDPDAPNPRINIKKQKKASA